MFQIVRRGTDLQNVYLSCTKGDLRLPWLVDLGLCRNTAQLVVIDSNRRLSWIVRNLTELPSIVVLMASGMVLRIV